MKLHLNKLILASSMLFSVALSAQSTLFVSPTGTDATNNCQLPGNPCNTIEYAYTQISAGDTIKLAPGAYNLNATLNLNQSVVLMGLDAANRPTITSTVADVINVSSNDVTISDIIFSMGLTNTSGLRGIVSNQQNFDKIKIENNLFESTNPISGTPNTNMVWSAFAISLVSNVTDFFTVEIKNNTIAAPATSNIFGRGIFLGNGAANLTGPGGIIEGNAITAYYAIQSVKNALPTVISNNTIHGITMINAPETGATIDINNNVFSGQTQMNPENLYALVEVRSNELATISFANNTVEDYSTIGFISEASKNLTVVSNTFNPLASATDFISLMANTKLMTNGVQGNTYADEISILGNTFNAGAANIGSAIVFADHYGANTPAFNAITIGGVTAADRNTFATALGNYIVLDGQAGASTSYALWAPYPATTMVPFVQDVQALASYNNYGFVNFSDIEAKNTDVSDNLDLGKVILKSTSNNRYVATTGSDMSNDCTLPGNPCATIEHAVAVSIAADTINVAAGNYAQTSILTLGVNDLTVRGTGATKPVITTNQTTVFDIAATNVAISNFRLELGLTSTTGKYGVVSTTSTFNNAKITDNEFISTSPVVPYQMVWDAFAIRLNSQLGAVDFVTISDNTVQTASANNNIFGRGISLGSGSTDGPGGVLENNTVQAYYAVQAIRTTNDFTINENQLKGITMINMPINNAVILFTENNLDAAVVTNYADSLYAVLEVRSIETGTLEISNNTIANFTRIGLLSMASKNVTVSENTFTPAATADQFVSLMANTKLMTNGVQGNTYANEISLVGNNFEAGAANKGTAIVFADHYGVTTPAFSSITVGGSAANLKNTFETDIANYIVMDDKTGPSTTEELWATYPSTTMKPFSQRVEALFANNNYNYSSIAEVELKNIDSLDNAVLGKVYLGESIGVEEVSNVTATLYPNPTTDFITVELKDINATATVSIIDMTGKVIYNVEIFGNKTFDVSALTSGVYVVKVTDNGRISSTKFVKH